MCESVLLFFFSCLIFVHCLPYSLLEMMVRRSSSDSSSRMRQHINHFRSLFLLSFLSFHFVAVEWSFYLLFSLAALLSFLMIIFLVCCCLLLALAVAVLNRRRQLSSCHIIYSVKTQMCFHYMRHAMWERHQHAGSGMYELQVVQRKRLCSLFFVFIQLVFVRWSHLAYSNGHAGIACNDWIISYMIMLYTTL